VEINGGNMMKEQKKIIFEKQFRITVREEKGILKDLCVDGLTKGKGT
jgi:hypothetical protein